MRIFFFRKFHTLFNAPSRSLLTIKKNGRGDTTRSWIKETSSIFLGIQGGPTSDKKREHPSVGGQETLTLVFTVRGLLEDVVATTDNWGVNFF